MQDITHQHIGQFIENDISDYLEHSEVHFGKYWDAEKRRKRIEEYIR